MAFTGMNIEQVRQMAGQMEQAAGEIEGITSKLTSVLDGTEWQGPDAEAFRGEWQGTHCTTLRQLQDRLREVANQAKQNAMQQEQASQS